MGRVDWDKAVLQQTYLCEEGKYLLMSNFDVRRGIVCV